MQPPDSASARVWTTIGAFALLSLVALFAYAPIFAVDFFWHLKLGQLIASERAIPRVDLFSSVHPERPYVQFQWLWELLAYGAYSLGGLTGVRLFQVVTLTSSYALLGWVSFRLLHSRALALCFCALALVLFEDRFQTRPSATALGFLALILPALLLPELRDRPSAWYLTVLVACVWSNIHSGESLVLPLCLGALAVGALLTRRFGAGSLRRTRRDGWLFLGACLGVLLSPAFVAGLADWTRAIGPQLSSRNKEWRPSYTMLENGLTPSNLLVAIAPTLVALIYIVLERRRARGSGTVSACWSEWLLCGGLLVLAHGAVRNVFLCLVPLCFVLVRLPRSLPVRTQRLVAALAAALLLAAFQDHVVAGYGGVAEAIEIIPEDLAPNAFPEQLTAFVREAQIEGKVLNEGRWGGYLIWHLWPACHVFVDSRQDLTAEMWPVFLYSQHADTRPAMMDKAFRTWGIELALFRGPTFPIIVAPSEWQLLYKAGDQELYQHRAGAHARSNRERVSRLLRQKLGRDFPEAQLASVATEHGAAAWLAAPSQQRRRIRAAALRKSPFVGDVVEGLLLDSQLLFDAGRYRAALEPLEQLLTLGPHTTKALYRYALASFASEERVRARWALSQLAKQERELSRAQRGRLAVLARELTSDRP